MSEIHEYDKNMWQGELETIVEAHNLLLSTEVNPKILDELAADINELEGFLKYGINEEGTGPDWP